MSIPQIGFNLYLYLFRQASKRMVGVSFLKVLLGDRNWRRPDSGTYRVDVDVAFSPIHNRYDTGVVIRDHKGKFVVVA